MLHENKYFDSILFLLFFSQFKTIYLDKSFWGLIKTLQTPIQT